MASTVQGSLFLPTALHLDRGIATTPEVDALLRTGVPVAMGVSGGKDSCLLGFALSEHLDRIGHVGPRILIHSDLGRVEWTDSAPTCRRLADRLGLELVTVRRQSGDMMDRWLTRWSSNVDRYRDLECVQLILPWSTPSMRFCTSELKTAIICRELVRRFPGTTILSASGIRRQESAKRRQAPITKVQNKLRSVSHRTTGLDWHPVIEWTKDELLAYLADRRFDLHEAYRIYGSSRVSCAFCIMGNRDDLIASTGHPDHADLYREMVDLEIASTFAFQGASWLGDVAPHLLTEAQRDGLADSKKMAVARQCAEARIPPHLLFRDGWPWNVPTHTEAELLCHVRLSVAAAVGLSAVGFTDPDALIERYEALIAAKPT